MTRVHALSISVLLFIAANGCNRGKEDAPKPKSTGPIEERAGLWYATGTSNLYTGTLTHQFPSGTNAAKSVYIDGLKLSQQAWHTNGLLKSEYLFHEGQLTVRRSWDVTGARQTWRKREVLADEQVQRGFDLIERGEFVAGYVWIHLAAANGQPVAKQALQQFPPDMADDQKAKAQSVADELLGRSGD
jgi:hypothetical protein